MIVHKGFENNTELKRRLKSISYKLNRLADNKTSHLSDIGISISYLQKDLINLMVDVFNAHKIEKNEN